MQVHRCSLCATEQETQTSGKGWKDAQMGTASSSSHSWSCQLELAAIQALWSYELSTVSTPVNTEPGWRGLQLHVRRRDSRCGCQQQQRRRATPHPSKQPVSHPGRRAVRTAAGLREQLVADTQRQTAHGARTRDTAHTQEATRQSGAGCVA